jgi:hypothetical protein
MSNVEWRIWNVEGEIAASAGLRPWRNDMGASPCRRRLNSLVVRNIAPYMGGRWGCRMGGGGV